MESNRRMVIINNEEFKKCHVKFLREHPEQNTKWFETLLPERPRDTWFLRVLPPIKKDSHVLDLCGGYGTFGAYLQSIKKLSFNYTCLDQSEHRIGCGSDYFRVFGLQEPQLVLYNARDHPLPFPSQHFDMVWLFGWCDRYFDCVQLFEETNRILKPKGHFLFNMAKSTSTHYETRFTKEQLFAVLKQTGFIVLHLDEIDGTDFGVVVQCLK